MTSDEVFSDVRWDELQEMEAESLRLVNELLALVDRGDGARDRLSSRDLARERQIRNELEDIQRILDGTDRSRDRAMTIGRRDCD